MGGGGPNRKKLDTKFLFAKSNIREQPAIIVHGSRYGIVMGVRKTMDLKLPEPLQLESRTSERLILARRTADHTEFVTVDFQWRRWQLGNHPHRMLNPVSRPHQGRRWRENLIEDAAQALLSLPVTKGLADAIPVASAIAQPAKPQVPWVTEAPAEPPEPPARAYSWKVLASGQISQAVSAGTPEALFQLAGFRPHRVQDPIQGFLAVPVQKQDNAWVEVERP